tara:strand:- start:104 stop:580 length:477 start_codon:yes stop_codon:yes gene_type:complete
MSKYYLTESEKDDIRKLHGSFTSKNGSLVKEEVKPMGGGSGFVDDQGSSQSLDKFNKRQQEMGEQVTELGSGGKKEFQKMEKYPTMKKLPTVGVPPVAPENETEISPEMTHDQFMDQLDGMCSGIIKDEELLATTNRSCGGCHKEEMTLLRKYCLTRA